VPELEQQPVLSNSPDHKSRKVTGDGVTLVLLILAAHVALAVAMKSVPMIGAVHAFTAVLGGSLVALFSKRAVYPAIAAAYIAGSEVLWRMTRAPIYWEYGKYGLALVLLMALLRQENWRRSGLPLLYFAFLVPASLMTLFSYPWEISREILSFNLSGPFSLCLAFVFFAQCKFSMMEAGHVVLALVTPIIGISALILLNMGDTVVSFGTGSNKITSGGFGPNQVSTVLAVACVGLFLLLVALNQSLPRRILFGSLLLVFTVQSVLTFSRAGLYYGVSAIVASSLFLVRDGRQRLQLLFWAVVLVGIGYYVLFPRLDEFTGGALAKRYADRHLTGRDEIMLADIEIFLKHAALGIGVGQAEEARLEYYGSSLAAHTEYTRLLAEHGVLGLFAAIILVVISLEGVRTARSPTNKAIMIGFGVYGLMFMTGNGMRLALASLCLGLARIRIWEGKPSDTPANATTVSVAINPPGPNGA
jgi:hypothetical protein